MEQIIAKFPALSIEVKRNIRASDFFPPQLPPHKSPSAKLSELRFRALLTEGGTERLELARA
jgi:hypothetical protein